MAECRKSELERKWGESAPIVIGIAMGGHIPCNFCKCVHAPGVNYYFDGEVERIETETLVS